MRRLILSVVATLGCAPAQQSGGAAPGAQALQPYVDSIPGSVATFEMVPVPGGEVTLPTPNGNRVIAVRPFWIGRTELTWDAYDPFAFGPGSGASRGSPEAVLRPSRPYGAPDYGYGHKGFPAISIAREAADAYCRWLSEKTGKRYRLPTEAEWEHAARLASGGRVLDAAALDSLAWHAGSSGSRSHAVAQKRADALGLHDLFGNVAEWVVTVDSTAVTRGGSWRDAASAVGPNAREVQDESWNERDPQIPKSKWWLSDGPFVGFRIVREM
jgi:formylglycine-generating enzyme required for sulfatase activity